MSELISLPVISMPEYVSPTAFKIFEHCHIEYYHLYLTNTPRKNFQTPAMAMGSLFDCYVKANIAQDLNWHLKDTKLKLDNLIKGAVEPTMLHLAPEAEQLFLFYKGCGAYQDLLTEQVTAVELENFKIVKDNQFKAGIPIFGKPDAKVMNTRLIDWKVNGYGSITGQSPKPGYSKIYDETGRKPGHKESWRTMDNVDKDWATQLSIYTWIERDEEILSFRDIEVGIEQLVFRNNKPRVASFRNIITADFQRNLYTHLELMWSYINHQKFEKPTPNRTLCFPYNRQCGVSDRCQFFKNVFNDKEFNEILGVKI